MVNRWPRIVGGRVGLFVGLLRFAALAATFAEWLAELFAFAAGREWAPRPPGQWYGSWTRVVVGRSLVVGHL